MINILSYVGMDLQSEVCLWTLLGIMRTIFDATLFKVNANLKQVWQIRMPDELTRPVQRVVRTMISGVILVQCFTVYVYLATYIVLLYPVFLEERPTLVLPWLLLAAIRKLLCELVSLTLGLGICVLLGPAKPPCIKFVIEKLASITPAFYMWLLIFSYYHTLKMSAAFKSFPAVLSSSNDRDYGLELAIRRRRTKSLQGEDQLRSKLIASLYGERSPSVDLFNTIPSKALDNVIKSRESSVDDIIENFVALDPLFVTSRTISEIGNYEDWFGNEVTLPRDTDRILEQFVVMLFRIAAYLKREEGDKFKLFTNSQTIINNVTMFKCTAVDNVDTDTPPDIGSSKSRMASYVMDYPQIFMKKSSDIFRPSASEQNLIQVQNTFAKIESDNVHNSFANNVDYANILNYARQSKILELDDHLVKRNYSIDSTLQTTNERDSEKNNNDKKIIGPSRSKNKDKLTCSKYLGSVDSLRSVRNTMKNDTSKNK